MRSRRLLCVTLTLSTAAISASVAQTGSGDRMAGGLTQGDYLRIGAGVTAPYNPQGSFKDWGNGAGGSLTWENWSAGATGVGRVGFGIGLAYALLPFKGDVFSSDFVPLSGGRTTS